jgi:uracil-DNA glycosylase family 4
VDPVDQVFLMGWADCEGCPLHGEPLVPSHGQRAADVMIVGEAPGQDEVKGGQPFVGRSGKLLRQVLTQLGFRLEAIYYTNACLCRPPANRTPTAAEVTCCQQRLRMEILMVQPKIIVPVGNTPIAAILGRGKGVSKRRGIYTAVSIEGQTFGVIPTYHPAAVLRNPGLFSDLASDLDLVRRTLSGEEAEVDPPFANYRVIDTQEKFELLLSRLGAQQEVAIDLETQGLDPHKGGIICAGFSWKRGTACVLDWSVIRGSEQNRTILGQTLSALDCSFHHGQFDVLWLEVHGVPVRYGYDTMLAHYLLDERTGTHGLKRLAAERYKAPDYAKRLLKTGASDSDEDLKDFGEVPRDQLYAYCGADVDYTLRLTQDLRGELARQGRLAWVMDEILIPAARHFTQLEREGILVDRAYLDHLGEAWNAEIATLEGQMRAYPGATELNFRSTKQLQGFLYGTLGLEPMKAGADGIVDMSDLLEMLKEIEDDEAQDFWRTAPATAYQKLKPTATSCYMLYWLAQQHDFPRLMVRYRLIEKRRGAYYSGILERLDSLGRIHPHYRIHGTVTGRLSSSNPNIHGIPKKKEIKKIFRADPGCVLVYADYNQAEVRMLAHYAQDPRLIRLLTETDIHAAISRELFNLTDEQMKALPAEDREVKRRAAKTLTFGMIYGRSEYSIAPQLGITVEQARKYKERFFAMMPDVKRWITRQRASVMRNHQVESLYGRLRRFDFIPDGPGAAEIQRQAVNMPIQSAVSDMTLLANLRAIQRLKDQGVPVRPWPSIHDAFIVQVPEAARDDAMGIVKEVMSTPTFETNVPFTMSIGWGPSWGEIHEE